ncbi:lipoxygenase family protein [Photorhabdus temperata]|uniref:lipoxygenase family protein n=1 Tax=Photorhabdus temperata TaxID=574560 RepID=UPI0009DFF7B2|nr:lipoxygenase family protein [Photorhabdus temperata]
MTRVDDTDALPEYPYRDDALLIWNSILKFVTNYIKIFYVTSYHIQSDTNLNNWMDDIIDNGKIKGFKKITSRDELSQVITMIIFTSSAQHAAVNFTQPVWMMYAPAMSGILSHPKPTVVENATKNEWLKMLPVLSRAMKEIDIFTVLGNLYHGYLGEYVGRDGNSVFNSSQTQISDILESFRVDLKNIETEINERNKYRLYPYDTLLPSKIPASINI